MLCSGFMMRLLHHICANHFVNVCQQFFEDRRFYELMIFHVFSTKTLVDVLWDSMPTLVDVLWKG